MILIQNRLRRGLAIIALVFGMLFMGPAQAESKDPNCTWKLLYNPITIAGASSERGMKFHCKNENDYYFLVSGLKPGKKLNPLEVMIIDPHGRRNSLQIKTSDKADSNGNMILSTKFKGYERRGTWNLSIAWKDETKTETSFDYVPIKPMLMVIRQKLDAEGQKVFTMVGTGFDPGKKLHLTAVAPGGKKLDFSETGADDYGMSQPMQVPMVESPKDGKYVFSLASDQKTASLKVECVNAVCRPENVY